MKAFAAWLGQGLIVTFSSPSTQTDQEATCQIPKFGATFGHMFKTTCSLVAFEIQTTDFNIDTPECM